MQEASLCDSLTEIAKLQSQTDAELSGSLAALQLETNEFVQTQLQNDSGPRDSIRALRLKTGQFYEQQIADATPLAS